MKQNKDVRKETCTDIKTSQRDANRNKALDLSHWWGGNQSPCSRFTICKYSNQSSYGFEMDLAKRIGIKCVFPCLHELYPILEQGHLHIILSYAYLLSNHYLMHNWREENLARVFYISSSSIRRVSILLCIMGQELPLNAWTSCSPDR